MLDQLETLIAFALIMLLLSLIITTFVQAFNVVLQRRGFNLLWGLEQILRQMNIDDEKIVKNLANRVLSHPALSAASRLNPLNLLKQIPWIGNLAIIRDMSMYATAIRVDELARVLGSALADPNVVPANEQIKAWYQRTQDAAKSLAKVLSSDSKTLAGQLSELGERVLGEQVRQLLPDAVKANVTADDLGKVINRVCTDLALDPAQPIEAALKSIGTRVRDALPAAAVTAEQLGNAIERTFAAKLAQVRKAGADLKAWFDTVMDRTTERFVAWNRWVSVAASFVLCLVLQVDGLDILKKLHTDKQLRAALVAQVDPTLEEAGKILALSSTGIATNALREMAADLRAAGYADNVPSDLDTRAKGENWLKENIKDPKQREALLAKYHDKFEELAKNRLDYLAKTRKELVDKLDETQVKLFPALEAENFKAWWCPLRKWHHLVGILMAWILLSLGAPFWFNMLKNLSNLRPILAGKVEKQPEGQSGSGTG
jgi:hypothetical protein